MISFDLVPSNAQASGTYIEVKNVRQGLAGLLIPQSIVVIGQFNDDKSPTPNVPKRIFSEGEEDTLYGRGSMLALQIKRVRQGCNNSIPIYALPVTEDVSGVNAAGSITITGTATESGVIAWYFKGKRITQSVASGVTGAALTAALGTIINADLDLPFTANFNTPNLGLTAKNSGVVGNTIKLAHSLERGDAVPAGLSITITQFASGAANPSIATALQNFANNFYTIVHCPYVDSTNLAALRDFWIERIGPSIKKPFVGFLPNNQAYADYLTTASGLNSQAITLIPNFESNTIAYEASAWVAGFAARWWQSSPARKMRGTAIPGVRVPSGLADWLQEDKEALVQAGASTLSISPDNQFVIEDLCTTRKTNSLGAPEPDWKKTPIISNIQAKIYSMDAVFGSEPFLTGQAVDDDSVTEVSFAIRPKFVKGTLIQLIDELWVPRALTKNRDTVVASISAEFDAGNGGRINTTVQDDAAAGLDIIAIAYNFAIGAGT